MNKPSITETMSLTITTIRRDPLILAPYVLFFIAIHLIAPWIADVPKTNPLTWSQQTWGFLATQWLAELVIKVTTIAIAIDTYAHLKSPIKGALTNITKRIITRFHKIFLSTLILAIPLSSILWINSQATPDSVQTSLLWIILAIALVPIGIMAELLPIIYLKENTSIWEGFTRVLRYMRHGFRSILILITLMMTLLMVTLILATLVSQIPLLGESILLPITQGIGYAIMYTLSLVLYELTTKP